MKLFQQIQRDLTYIKEEFPKCFVLFSEILCRQVWRNLKWKEGEKEKVMIVSETKKFLRGENFIQHPRIIGS